MNTVHATAGDQVTAPGKASGVAPLIFAVAIAVAACAVGAMLFIDLPKTAIGVLVMALSIVLPLTGIPVGIAMLGAALLGLWALAGPRVVASTMRSDRARRGPTA